MDLDSTICETYGLDKEWTRHHGYTGARGYHPLLAVAAGTGDVLMSRLREGRANTARGAAHFLWETVRRVRYAGARDQLTVRADSGFYTHALVSACRKLDVRFSVTIRQHTSLRSLIEAIPEADWTPIPYWMDGAHRPGRADRDRQDPKAPLLLPGRTAHPLSTPPHSAPSPALALGEPIQPRPRPAARPPAPFLTAPIGNCATTTPSLAIQSNISPTRAGWASERFLLPPIPP